jgi:hypothetical protein
MTIESNKIPRNKIKEFEKRIKKKKKENYKGKRKGKEIYVIIYITGQNRCYRVHIGYISGTRYVSDMCEICV